MFSVQGVQTKIEKSDFLFILYFDLLPIYLCPTQEKEVLIHIPLTCVGILNPE